MRGLFIGRFQPFHLGHLKAIEYALEGVDELVVGIGSSQYSHTSENPFTAEERKRMIVESLPKTGKYVVVEIPDVHNDGIWVQHVVKNAPEFQIVYTSGLLEGKLFRKAGFHVKKIPFFSRSEYSATNIRSKIRAGDNSWTKLVPEGTRRVIEEVGCVERIKKLKP